MRIARDGSFVPADAHFARRPNAISRVPADGYSENLIAALASTTGHRTRKRYARLTVVSHS
jgi:hypothetical protein